MWYVKKSGIWEDVKKRGRSEKPEQKIFKSIK